MQNQKTKTKAADKMENLPETLDQSPLVEKEADQDQTPVETSSMLETSVVELMKPILERFSIDSDVLPISIL